MQENDVSVTKFLQQNANVTQKEQNGQRMNIIQFLEDNDISVTKFLNYMENHLDERQQNILITEFLDSSSLDKYFQWALSPTCLDLVLATWKAPAIALR